MRIAEPHFGADGLYAAQSRVPFFELLVRRDADPDLQALDLQPADRHLLLLAKEVRYLKRGRDGVDLSRFLCGHDECSWFVAAVPGAASSVREAMETLKPEVVRESQARHKVKTKRRNKRKNEGFIRQGEWFFIPCPEMQVDEMLVLKDEPLRRGRGKPHMAEFLFRRGGTTVLVCHQYPNGLTEGEYARLVREHPEKAKLNWQTMSRDPEAFVKGKIRHSDHKTVVLPFWRRAVPNSEPQGRSESSLVFLD